MAKKQTPEKALADANAITASAGRNFTIGTTKRKKRVLLRAPVLTASGYGVHSRQIFRWLESKDVDIFVESLSWGITTWLINPEMDDGFIGRILDRSMKVEGRPEMSIQVQLPNEWDATLADFNVGVTAAVETDRCNPKWIDDCNKMDLIIVPTEHIKSVLVNSGDLTTKIVVVPESYILEIEDETIEPIDLEFDTDFNFLMVGQLTGTNAENDRKNTWNTLRWMCETFKNDKEVGIILKANSGRNTHIDRKFVQQNVHGCLSQVRQGEYPKVHLLHGLMSSREMVSLYRHPSIKGFVSLTRGEGFCLPMMEAAASGIPVIATDWSGHLDFMNKGRFIKVDYDLQGIPKSRQDENIFMKNAKWAEPKESSAKKVLKKFHRSSEIPAKWALDLQKTLLEDYSHKAICSHYDSALLEFFTA